MKADMNTFKLAARQYTQARNHESYLSLAYNLAWNYTFSHPERRNVERMKILETELEKAVNGTEDALAYLHSVIRTHQFTDEDWREVEELL